MSEPEITYTVTLRTWALAEALISLCSHKIYRENKIPADYFPYNVNIDRIGSLQIKTKIKHEYIVTAFYKNQISKQWEPK